MQTGEREINKPMTGDAQDSHNFYPVYYKSDYPSLLQSELTQNLLWDSNQTNVTLASCGSQR